MFTRETLDAMGGTFAATHNDTETQYKVKAYDFDGGELELVSELVPESLLAETVAQITAYGFVAVSERVREATIN